VTASRTYTLKVVGTYLLDELSPGVPQQIALSVAGVILKPAASPPTVNKGEFLVFNVPANPETGSRIDFRLPDDLTGALVPSVDHPLPVHLVVNGATATPIWITEETP